MSFAFTDPPELSGGPFLQLSDVAFQYEDGPAIFAGVSLGVWATSRVAVVGANGAGKSTLLNLLTGELSATGGLISRNPRLRIGRYTQHFVDALPLTETPVAYLQALGAEYDRDAFASIQHCRAQLGRYGLEAHAHLIPMSKLSGGQKARVVFAGIPVSAPHMLLLDEPTNHLDIESIEALGQAIRAFKGGVVLVSHDARLIRTAVEESDLGELWVVGGGGVTTFDGTIDEYSAHVLAEMEELGASADGKSRLRAVEGASCSDALASSRGRPHAAEQDKEEQDEEELDTEEGGGAACGDGAASSCHDGKDDEVGGEEHEVVEDEALDVSEC